MNAFPRHAKLRKAIAAFASCIFIGMISPPPAWVDAADPLRVDARILCTMDGTGHAFVPAATLENTTDYGIVITSAEAPSNLAWQCDAEGKTIPAHSSMAASWTAIDALPEHISAQATSVDQVSIGQFTYRYTYERPIPALTGSISISGKRVTGSTLSARAQDAPDDAALSWQWFKNGTAIEGAATAVYTLREGDDGAAIECRARDSSGAYAGDLRSDAGSIALAYYLGYTMAETKEIARDIAKNGQRSSYYAEMLQGLRDDAVGMMRLRDGSLYTFRLADILHDEASTGGKAGLAFVRRHGLPIAGQANPTNTNVGGWQACALRASLNSGAHWALFSNEFQQSICSVEKATKNAQGTSKTAATKTSDKVWLLSLKEIAGGLASHLTSYCPSLDDEGTQYACFTPFLTSTTDRPSELFYQMVCTVDEQLPQDSTGLLFRLRTVANTHDTAWYCGTQLGKADAAMSATLMHSIVPGWCIGEAA